VRKALFAADRDDVQISTLSAVQFYLIKDGGVTKICEPDKCDCSKRFNIKKLPANLIPAGRQAVQDFSAAISYTEFGWD
jgi:hypothetical protein